MASGSVRAAAIVADNVQDAALRGGAGGVGPVGEDGGSVRPEKGGVCKGEGGGGARQRLTCCASPKLTMSSILNFLIIRLVVIWRLA